MSTFLRPQAKEDLFEVWLHIAKDNPEKADAVLDSIDHKITLLSQMPGLGRGRSELQEALRSFAIGTYVVFYFERPDGGIEIVRFLHGSLDIENIFEEKLI